MNCEEAARVLDRYLDLELELNARFDLERHLSLCTSCWCLAQERRESRSFFTASAPRFKAPPQLRTTVLAVVRRDHAKQTFAFLRQPWIYAAAVLVLSLSLALNILFPDVGKAVSLQAVLCHCRSLSGDHLVDVASADPEVVKSWLSAKLNFSPPVVGFPSSTYSLLGGRVEAIQDRLVATIIYKSDKDVVTLFCWQPKKEQLPQGENFIEGYHVCTWSNAECNYILISKANVRAMDEFMDSLRDQVQGGVIY
jgi:anti-sigma factor RsiW